MVNEDYGYIHKIENFAFKKHFIEGCQKLQDLNFMLFIVTNQSGLGRGIFDEQQYNCLTNYYNDQLKKNGVFIKEIVYCPHSPSDNCKCRKPKSYMVDQLVERYNISRSHSAMIGDKKSDLECAKRANLRFKFFVRSPDESYKTNDDAYVVSNLLEVVTFFKTQGFFN